MKNIILGWWFWITNRNNKLAQKRLSICVPCAGRKKFVCSYCGCMLQAKSRIEEERCPLGKWENPDRWNGCTYNFIDGGFTG